MTEADLPPTDPEFHESGQSPQSVTAAELEHLLAQHREWVESKL